MMGIRKALVVDDSRLARVALTKLLIKRGLEVDTAACGEEALDYLRDGTPDVVFLDYMMPDMTGFEAADAINLLLGEGQLPIVMYTSQDTPEDRRRARELGVCGFLTKPSSEEGLDQVLQELRERPPAAAAALGTAAGARLADAGVALPPTPAAPSPDLVDAGHEHPDPALQAVPAAGRRDLESVYPDLFTPGRGQEPDPAEADYHSEIWLDSPDTYSDSLSDSPGSPGSPPAAEQPQQGASPPATADPDAMEQRIRAISQQVVKDALAAMRGDWKSELSEWKLEFRGMSSDLQESTMEAAARASQESTSRVGREIRGDLLQEWGRLQTDLHQASVSGAEKVARGTADSVARDLAEEIAERTARRIAEQVLEDYAAKVDQRLAGLGGKEDVAAQARLALASALGDLSSDQQFQAQIAATLMQRGVPMLKNSLDHWVREVAEETALQSVRDAVARSTEALVKEAIIASAEAAVSEIRESRRKRRIFSVLGVLGWLVLAAGVAVSLARSL